MATRNVVCLRSVQGEANLKVSLFVRDQWLQFNRPKEDLVSKTLQRIALKISSKKKKKSKEDSGAMQTRKEAFAKLLNPERQECDLQTLSNENGLIAENILQLGCNRDIIDYKIILNPPTIIDCNISDNIMAGFPIFPELKTEFATVSYSKFSWYKSLPENEDWTLVGTDFIYTPNVGDIGHRLKLSCEPGNEDGFSPVTSDYFPKGVVSAGPGLCLFDQRHLYTKKSHPLESNKIRVVCYNILADVFATSDFAKTTLFPYAPDYVLSLSYRKLLLAKEILGYNADFISLQECGKTIFNSYLKPMFALNGLDGFYFEKLGEMPEGEAIFYRQERYDHRKNISISIRDALYLDCNKEILIALTDTPVVLEDLHKKTAVGQIHLFTDKHSSKQICILNTHLYYKRFSQNIRILQMAVLMNYLARQIDIKNTSIIVNGDLNSLRSDDLLQYLSGTEINPDSSVWDSVKSLDSAFNMTTLKTPITLKNASGLPVFTSFVPHCMETLDYIFCDQSFDVSSFIPMPEAEEILPYVGLPCIGSPSDHLAVVIDLEWSGK